MTKDFMISETTADPPEFDMSVMKCEAYAWRNPGAVQRFGLSWPGTPSLGLIGCRF